MARIGRWLVAISLVVFGVQHFLYAKFISTLIPAWIPGQLFWAYFVGVAFFAAALGMFVDKVLRPTATLLGVMFLIFVLTIHIPRIVGNSGNGNEWTSGLVALAMCGGAWMIATIAPLEERETGGPLLKLGAYFFAAALIGFGLLHFANAQAAAHVGPPWLGGRPLFAYSMGSLLLIAGAWILAGKNVQYPATALAAVLLLLFLLVYLPRLASEPDNPAPWTSGFEILAMCGMATMATDRASAGSNSLNQAADSERNTR